MAPPRPDERRKYAKQLLLVVVVMLPTALAGAVIGFWFLSLFMTITVDEIGVRASLALFACFVVAFFWTLVRMIRGQPPLDLTIRLLPSAVFKVAADESPWMLGILGFLLAYMISNTVFR